MACRLRLSRTAARWTVLPALEHFKARQQSDHNFRGVGIRGSNVLIMELVKLSLRTSSRNPLQRAGWPKAGLRSPQIGLVPSHVRRKKYSTTAPNGKVPGPLDGVRILDFTRVLAGPCKSAQKKCSPRLSTHVKLDRDIR